MISLPVGNGAPWAFTILFAADSADYTNAVVMRELEDTDLRHLWRTKLFRMACAIGLFDDPVKQP